MLLRDHPAIFRREEYIAELAEDLRRLGRDADFAYFNIVDFIREVLQKSSFRKGTSKEKLQIDFYDAAEGSNDLASVSFKPLTLHVDRQTWEDAAEGEPKARFILAHEIGHIMLHETDVQHFSNNASLRIQYQTEEHSAEWQANIFASYFLIPTRLMAAFDSVEQMSTATAVTDPFVLARHSTKKRQFAKQVSVDGQACDRCGNLTVTSDGICRSEMCAASTAPRTDDLKI